MSADWRRLSRSAGFRIVNDRVEVAFEDDRRQALHVDEVDPEHLRLWSIVAPARDVKRMETPELYAWRRNRVIELVGFRLDRQGRLIGETFVPTEGLTVAEWQLYVRSLARASDRTEYLMTGRDDG